MIDYEKQFIQAIAFIESNLTKPITLADISRSACLSGYHFSRVFHLCLGETLSSYIRKRRLTTAAQMLLETDRPILEIALEFQFDSQEAFTRSFKRQYFLPPGQFRKYGKYIHWGTVPPLSEDRLSHLLHGGITMQPEFVLKDEITIIGFKCSNTMRKIRIPALWRKFIQERNKIENMIDGTTYGIYLYDTKIEKIEITDELEFEYLAGVEVTQVNRIPTGMTVHRIPARKYAVFTHRGRLMELQKTYDYIYKTWLPGSGMDFLPAEHFEYHGPNFTGDTPESETQVYIPIKTEQKYGG